MSASDGLAFLFAILLATVLGALYVAVLGWALAPGPAARRLCDRQVAILLDSRDATEVQRAGILVHEIPCDVVRRIPARAP